MENHPSRRAYNEYFLQELKRLDSAQRQAADHFDGPMLVIAGPGTGKTHILGARIGRILLETDTLPENILCLTFTDAGVIAMRERLQQFIGPAAHRVHIFTFHAFCNAVIRDQPEYFGSHELEPLSDLERIDLIRKLIDEIPPGHILYKTQTNPYFFEKALLTLFQRMQMEDWAPEYLEQEALAWLEQLPERPEFKYKTNRAPHRKGDLKTEKLEEQRLRMERLIAAARLFPRYEQLKTQVKRYDYEDMILWVLRAFDQHPALLRNYQERYLYVLVDEYQDTNGAQNEILLKLISYWEQPNVFIVGDDDQSIYEFQGARLKNLLDFHQHYARDLEVVVLTKNFRSSQPILDWAGQLIRKNTIRVANHLPEAGAGKQLIAANPQRVRSKEAPVICLYPNRLQETAHIALQIEALIQQGVPASEIAVIYARHQQAEQLSMLLARRGTPFAAKRNIDVLQTPIIRQILQILDFIRHEYQRPHSGAHLLYRILHFRFWNIRSQDLARISYELEKREGPEQIPWRIALQSDSFLLPLNLSSSTQLTRAAGILEDLIGSEANLPLPALVEKLINQTGLLQTAINQAPEQNTSVELLFSFLSFVRETALRQPGLDLQGFFQILARMQDNRLPLAFVQQDGAAQAVQLVTAHSAKGLEFHYVFMLDCTKEPWEPNNRNQGNFSLPETLNWSGEEDALEARRRLFYVAMTRAREFLHISFSEKDDNGKPLQRAAFIDELLENHPGSLQTMTLPPAEVRAAQIALIQDQAPPVLPEGLERSLVEEKLQDFRLSITALNSYLECPLGFYFEYIAKAPYLPSEAALYGQAMHYAMQRLFDSMRSSKPRIFPAEKKFIQFFIDDLSRKKGLLRPTTFEKYLEQGKRFLSQYYKQHLGAWHKDVSTEYTVRQVEVEGVPITGTIDKIEYHKKRSIGVVDYKTGRHSPERLRPPSDAHPYGGAYWRQLVFYKLLFEALDRSSRQVTFGEIAYLEPDAAGQFRTERISLGSDEAQFMRELLQSAYTRIRAHDFYTGCGNKDCPWCTLVRQEILPPSLSNPALEALDD